MAIVEPIPDAPAATASPTPAGETLLLLADYHAGVEVALRADGVELESRAAERRGRVLGLLERTGADRVVVLGDLLHTIGGPGTAETEELDALLAALPADVGLTVVKGNHDGDVEASVDPDRGFEVLDPRGARIGELGVAHGHTWPAEEVLEAEVMCIGHEHPTVRLEDAVGGRRIERVWLRGRLAPAAFTGHAGDDVEIHGELIVFPAFNDLAGGTWVNVAGQDFLSPFLPAGLADGEAFLLDGTRLGPYDRV